MQVRSVPAVVVLAAAMSLGGCAVGGTQTPAQVDEALSDPIDQAASAVATAALTARLLRDDRLTAAAADVAIADALHEVIDARGSLAMFVPPDAESNDRRTTASAAVGLALDAVADARAWVNASSDGPGAADVVAELADAAAALDAQATS